jgi:hypothetical protein
MHDAARDVTPADRTERWELSADLLTRVLVPYRDNCKYLKRMWMEYRPAGPGVSQEASDSSIVAFGDLSIGESCYIDSTGHFNAVEFQICANQLMYAMGAECARRHILSAFWSIDLDGFYERQLPNVLITNVKATFRRVVNPRRFHARLALDRSYVIGDRAFWECSVAYTDDEDGLADGTIVVTLGLGANMAPKGDP